MASQQPEQAPTPVLDEKHVAGSEADARSSTAGGLSEDEQKIISKQLDAPDEKVGYFALFRYANKKDIAIMVVATIASIVAGACLPLMTVSRRTEFHVSRTSS
jgi:ATP-binding cassette, subfamily B (MDR/TAP), member 1